MTCVLTGACQVLMDVFDAETVLDLASEKKATILHGFEAHWLDLFNAQKIGRESYKSDSELFLPELKVQFLLPKRCKMYFAQQSVGLV